jgi:hypothetical protein
MRRLVEQVCVYECPLEFMGHLRFSPEVGRCIGQQTVSNLSISSALQVHDAITVKQCDTEWAEKAK